jgi:hypothetical protein
MTEKQNVVKMVKVFVPGNIHQFDVSDFPADAQRSVKGALYFRPNTVFNITEAEADQVKKARPDIANFLRFTPVPVRTKKNVDDNKAKEPVQTPKIESNKNSHTGKGKGEKDASKPPKK